MFSGRHSLKHLLEWAEWETGGNQSSTEDSAQEQYSQESSDTLRVYHTGPQNHHMYSHGSFPLLFTSVHSSLPSPTNLPTISYVP